MTTKDEKAKMWSNVLLFLAGEWFGSEFIKEFLDYKMDLGPIQEDETKIDCDLGEHEKIFWNFLDSLFKHLQRQRNKMPAGELQEKKRMAAAFKTLFWASIQLAHEEFMEAENIGIRGGYMIVEQPPQQTPNPLVEIFKGPFGRG